VAGLGATAVMCGRCEFCRSGHFIFCKHRRGMGHGVHGAFTTIAGCKRTATLRGI
jgi:L-iditol 2-dehydrogenase